MHVTSQSPVTWQGRAPEVLATRLGVAERALGWYRRLSTGPVLDGIRAMGKRWQTRMNRARSATQTPSALERLFEDACVFKAAGATSQQLRALAVEWNQFVTDLEDRPADNARVLAAIHSANVAAGEEARAESLLTTRAHRRLDESDLDRLIAATSAAIAASTEQLEAVSALKREQSRARHGMAVVR